MQRPRSRSSLRTPLIAGGTVAALFFAGFGGWSAGAPLASAVIAPGVIIPEGNRKTVQHLEGGLVQAILVREGDMVAPGDPLVRLDDTQVAAEHETLLGRWRTAKATELRLIAEREDAARIHTPAETMAGLARDGRLAEQIASEQAHLDARRASLADQVAVLRRQMREGEETIHGLRESIESQTGQLRLIEDELAGTRFLFEKGLIAKPRLLAVERARLQLEGQLGMNQAEIARTGQKIAAARMQIAGLQSARAEEVAGRLAEVQADLATIEEKLRISHDRMSRTVILAPVAGTIVQLQVRTPGGVIAPGQPLMDIVPSREELVVEARVAPTDIDEVHAGLKAQLQLLAYKSRNLPRVDGIVRKVSADRSTDDRTGQAYFIVHVAVDAATLPDNVALSAGMPAEAFILTGARTLLQYLLQPVTDVLRRGLRES